MIYHDPSSWLGSRPTFQSAVVYAYLGSLRLVILKIRNVLAVYKQKFAHFVKLLQLEDQTQRLRLIQREEELRDELKAKRQAIQNELEVRYRASSRE